MLKQAVRNAAVALGALLVFFGGLLAGVGFNVQVVHPSDLCMEDEAYAVVDPGYDTPGYTVRQCVNVEELSH